MTRIGDRAFDCCSYMTSFICKSVTPPQCHKNTFSFVNTDDCPLYVPQDSIEFYKKPRAGIYLSIFFLCPIRNKAPKMYRTILLYFLSIILNLGITYAQNSETIRNKEAGHLSTCLSEKQWENTEVLIIRGDINKDDIRFIAQTAKEHQHLKSIDLSHTNLRELGLGLFDGCCSLAKSNYPRRWNHRKNAFRNCKELEVIMLPSKVTNIGTEAFDGCINLPSITIPKNVGWIGNNAFSNCPKLKIIKVKKGIPNFMKKMDICTLGTEI